MALTLIPGWPNYTQPMWNRNVESAQLALYVIEHMADRTYRYAQSTSPQKAAVSRPVFPPLRAT